MLEQRIGTPTQQRWLSKLLGNDFLVEYRRGKDNKAADALSRREEDEEVLKGAVSEHAIVMAISSPNLTWIDSVKAEYTGSAELQQLKDKFEKCELDLTLYTSHAGIIFYKGKIYLASKSPLRYTILKQLHENPLGDTQVSIRPCNRCELIFFGQDSGHL